MDKLHELARQVIESFTAGGKTVFTAESCTGGLVSAALTHVPDSSKVFLGGIVAYANGVKVRLLGVNSRQIAEHGAVSEEVVSQMAEGARNAGGADFGVAITGIAGPGGGSASKPVGLVFIAVAGESVSIAKELRLQGDREEIRNSAAAAAIELLLSVFQESILHREIRNGHSNG